MKSIFKILGWLFFILIALYMIFYVGRNVYNDFFGEKKQPVSWQDLKK